MFSKRLLAVALIFVLASSLKLHHQEDNLLGDVANFANSLVSDTEADKASDNDASAASTDASNDDSSNDASSSAPAEEASNKD